MSPVRPDAAASIVVPVPTPVACDIAAGAPPTGIKWTPAPIRIPPSIIHTPVSYTHLRAHETKANLVCRLLLEKKKKKKNKNNKKILKNKKTQKTTKIQTKK